MTLTSKQLNQKLDQLKEQRDQPIRVFSKLSNCLEDLQGNWEKDKSIATLWQDWPQIIGSQLGEHCWPISFQRGVLTIGASHPQWRQALLYSRPEILHSLRANGHQIKDIRVQQHHPKKSKPAENESIIWSKHPSRVDVHGVKDCPNCSRPSPAGEIILWGECGFCKRVRL